VKPCPSACCACLMSAEAWAAPSFSRCVGSEPLPPPLPPLPDLHSRVALHEECARTPILGLHSLPNAQLKNTLEFVLTAGMRDGDQLGVMSFQSSPALLQRPAPCTAAHREATWRQVQALEAGGGTRIDLALTAALDVLLGASSAAPGEPAHTGEHSKTATTGASRPPATPTCILLLTDGCNDSGSDRAPFRAPLERADAAAVPVFALGLGADHDSALLTHIATSTRGQYSYIERATDTSEAFALCMGMLTSSVAEDFTVEFALDDLAAAVASGTGGSAGDEDPTVPAPAEPLPVAASGSGPAARLLGNAGVTIASISSAFPTTVALNRRSGSVRVGKVFAEERKEVLLHISLPIVSLAGLADILAAGGMCKQPLLTARCTYTESATGERRVIGPALLSVQRFHGDTADATAALAAGAVENNAVQVSLHRDLTARTLREADGMLADGKRAEAVAHVQAAMERIRSSSLATSDPVVVGLLTGPGPHAGPGRVGCSRVHVGGLRSARNHAVQFCLPRRRRERRERVRHAQPARAVRSQHVVPAHRARPP